MQSNQLLLFAWDCPGFNIESPASQETLQSQVVTLLHTHQVLLN